MSNQQQRVIFAIEVGLVQEFCETTYHRALTQEELEMVEGVFPFLDFGDLIDEAVEVAGIFDEDPDLPDVP